MVRYLLQNDADLYNAGHDDSTSFMIACEYGNYEIVQYLLCLDESNFHVLNAIDNQGSTALHKATLRIESKKKMLHEVENRKLDIVKLLLEQMGESRHPTHVALYDSSYVILFDNGDWLSQGLTNNLTRKMKQSKSNIEFLTLGPDGQWFFRLHNGKVFYNVKDENLRDELKSSTVRPYKLWFNDDDGYVLQFDDLSLSWDNIPIDFHKKLNGRQKSLSKVKDIAFGVNDTWRVSFQDGTARQSSNLPSYINKHLKQTECLVLDPVDGENYFIFKDNGKPEWQVNGDFDDDINVSDEEDDDDDIVYMDPQSIRYTQKSISPHFSNGKTIEELRQELADGTTTVDEIPTIDVVQTRSGNLWSLNNRRLWCFRHAHNIDQIPVNIVDEKPSWFHNRIEKLENPFHIRIRGSSETGFHSDVDHDSDSDDYDY